MGSENRIQKLNRELRELATNARKEREEFRQFTARSRGTRRSPLSGSMTNDESNIRSCEE